MVDRRITDGARIGQLLASELTGLRRGVLGAVSVVDADPDAEPSPAGTEAYRVSHDGTVVATVSLYPEHVTLCLHGGTWPETPGELTTVSGDRLRIESGAGVKRAVDALRDALG